MIIICRSLIHTYIRASGTSFLYDTRSATVPQLSRHSTPLHFSLPGLCVCRGFLDTLRLLRQATSTWPEYRICMYGVIFSLMSLGIPRGGFFQMFFIFGLLLLSFICLDTFGSWTTVVIGGVSTDGGSFGLSEGRFRAWGATPKPKCAEETGS